MAELNFYETGKLAPANVTRNFGAIYIWVTPKGAVNYIQKDFPRGRNWQLLDLVGGVKYLNDLLDVQTNPNPGDFLSYDGTIWVNVPAPVSPDVELGNAVIVSSKGKTVAAGAVRESFTNHFSDLGEAISAAISGDTIYIYGGSHNLFVNLVKTGVTVKCIGEPVIRCFTSLAIADNGVPSTINISGDGIFQGLVGGVINISANDTLAKIECKSITSPGGATVRLAGGREGCILDVKDFLDNTSVNYTLRFELNANWLVNCPLIYNSATSIGGFKECVLARSSYSGDSTVNAHRIECRSTDPAHNIPVTMDNGPLSGGILRVNVTDGVYQTTNAGVVTGFSAVVSHLSNNLILRGDLYGGTGQCYDAFTSGVLFDYKGKMTNDGTTRIGRTGNAAANHHLDGEFVTSNPVVIEHTNGKLQLDGKYVNTKSDGGSPSCLLTSSAIDTIINTAKFIVTIFDGSEEPLRATSAKTVKVIHSAAMNAVPNANVTNSIAATAFTVDAGIE